MLNLILAVASSLARESWATLIVYCSCGDISNDNLYVESQVALWRSAVIAADVFGALRHFCRMMNGPAFPICLSTALFTILLLLTGVPTSGDTCFTAGSVESLHSS